MLRNVIVCLMFCLMACTPTIITKEINFFNEADSLAGRQSFQIDGYYYHKFTVDDNLSDGGPVTEHLYGFDRKAIEAIIFFNNGYVYFVDDFYSNPRHIDMYKTMLSELDSLNNYELVIDCFEKDFMTKHLYKPRKQRMQLYNWGRFSQHNNKIKISYVGSYDLRNYHLTDLYGIVENDSTLRITSKRFNPSAELTAINQVFNFKKYATKPDSMNYMLALPDKLYLHRSVSK